jgi:aldehyde dehydrogenase (NAD+)
MRLIDKIYIDGSFVSPHGTELFDLHNPATAQVIGRARLADEQDARTAIAAAKRAFPAFARTNKAERIALLRRMHAAMKARREELLEAIVEEYGAPSRVLASWPTTRQMSCSIWPGCWRTIALRVASAWPR